MRFPILCILAIGLPLIGLTFFYFTINTGLNDVNTFPDAAKTKEAFIVLKEEFFVGEVNPAGVLSPAEIVIDGDIDNPKVEAAIAKLEQSIIDSPDFPVPAMREVNDARDLALLTLPFPGESNSRAATEKLIDLRDIHVPAAFDGVDAQVYVGGVTAEATDFYGIVDQYTPIVFAFVLGLSFLILMMVFRSIVIPLKAIIMNLFSVGATYGLLVLVFQKGWARTCWGSSTLRSSTRRYRCSCSPSSSGSPLTTTCSCSAASESATTRPRTTPARRPTACVRRAG